MGHFFASNYNVSLKVRGPVEYRELLRRKTTSRIRVLNCKMWRQNGKYRFSLLVNGENFNFKEL